MPARAMSERTCPNGRMPARALTLPARACPNGLLPCPNGLLQISNLQSQIPFSLGGLPLHIPLRVENAQLRLTVNLDPRRQIRVAEREPCAALRVELQLRARDHVRVLEEEDGQAVRVDDHQGPPTTLRVADAELRRTAIPDTQHNARAPR